MHDVIDPSTYPKRPLIEELSDALTQLHGDPFNLFLCCFEKELRQQKNLNMVLYHSCCVPVRILKSVWRPADVTVLLNPIIEFIFQTPSKNIQCLFENLDTAPSQKVYFKLIQCVTKILNPDKIPVEICVLCFRCVTMIENERFLTGIYRPASQWVIGSLIFHRILVPFLLKWGHVTPYISEDARIAAGILAKFLTKLCNRSFFGASGCLLNDVLIDSYQTYDRFCDKIVKIGELNNHKIHTPRGGKIEDESLLMEMTDCLHLRGHSVAFLTKKVIESEGGREFLGLSSEGLFLSLVKRLDGLKDNFYGVTSPRSARSPNSGLKDLYLYA